MSSPVTHLHPDDAASLRAAMAAADAAFQAADRARMRFEGAKAALLDAKDALSAVWLPIATAHGIDPAADMRLTDDGTLVPVEQGK